ncbi:hypothetical protein PsYK624_083260 [Phanerochaete sordida]|uniref:Uncharacterized protein n=1 Tax=Phanerochaete sordida TaxID=48140 RepID=A0A9P3LF38_9APHY|nr:hypothetical protein PsYK624_083260 [Phanerochaete sordida]
MHAFRRPSLGADAHHRAPSFTVRDFEQLVTSAFDLPSPTLVLTPASPQAPGPRSAASTVGRSYFDDSTDENHLRRRETRRTSERPRSQSFSAFNFRGILPSSSSTHGEPSARPGITRRVLKTLRTRASAFVLRPSPSSASDRDTRASVATLTPRTSTSTTTARPPSQYSTATQSPRYAFPTRDENSPPSTLRGSPDSNVELDVKVSVTRHRSSSLPLNILKIPQHASRDGPRSAHTPLPRPPRSKSPAPTFLGDLISARRTTTTSFSSSRSRTPSQPSLAGSPPLRVHTRLPPLNKSRSFNLLSGHNRKHSRANSMADPILPSLTGASSMSIEFDEGELPAWCPEPYTNPRPPPPPPTPTSPFSASHDLWRHEDSERPLDAPPYVFERRDSSSSINSTATSKSTQTLADRISQAIPRSLKMSKLRSRSKLNLSVITSSSNDSNSSSFDTSTTFSSGAGSMPPTPHTNSFYGISASRRTSMESEADTVPIDRVLTPEQDPFAKGDIEVPRSRTPMPFEVPDSPTQPKWSPLEKKIRSRTVRKKSSGSGHSHTNSGDTITPLTSGLDSRPCSPMDIDGPDMQHRPFVFPTPEMTMSSLSPSPSPTPYSDWSPISLRQSAALPNLGDFPAYIVPLPSSPTPSRRSVGSPIPPSPGPPPSIPLPPSPTPLRTEFMPTAPPSPRLRKRKSQNSLRVTALLSGERPPSPFPMAASAVSSVASLLDPVAADDAFVSELDAADDDADDDMPTRGNGGWVRGPRFALAAEPPAPVWPVPPQGFGPPREVSEPSKGPQGQRLPPLSHEFSALGFSVDNKPFPPSPTRSKPRMRPSQSDSALRTRSKADARPGLGHGRSTSHHGGRARGGSAVTLSEIEERWEGDTSRSTAFYSARSSMLSTISSAVHAGEAL